MKSTSKDLSNINNCTTKFLEDIDGDKALAFNICKDPNRSGYLAGHPFSICEFFCFTERKIFPGLLIDRTGIDQGFEVCAINHPKEKRKDILSALPWSIKAKLIVPSEKDYYLSATILSAHS